MIRILPYTSSSFAPLSGDAAEFFAAGKTIRELILDRFPPDFSGEVVIRGDFVPSQDLADILAGDRPVRVLAPDGESVLAHNGGNSPVELFPDTDSVWLCFPWDLLRLNEILLAHLTEKIEGTVREGVTIDGTLRLGRGSILLPGVYIEGNVIIGEHCKIGPNCYIRGYTAIGDHCHIGQAVEIKNSLIGEHTAIGHLSYAGDSIIGKRVNFGAGTIISNFRHDGQNHRFKVDGKLISTGRRKFGAVIGDGVHTGIHTAIYPGRSLISGASTLPGEVVKR